MTAKCTVVAQSYLTCKENILFSNKQINADIPYYHKVIISEAAAILGYREYCQISVIFARETSLKACYTVILTNYPTKLWTDPGPCK